MRTSSVQRVVVFAFAFIAMGVANSANAVVVDYLRLDIGLTAQRVEAGFQGISAAAGNVAPTAVLSDLGDALTVALSNVNASGVATGGLDWRDRGNSTSVEPLVQVGEDFVKNNAGIIRMTLTGLRAGTYEATSIHRDPGFSQSNPIQLEISVDGAGFLVDPATGDASANIAVNSLTTANVLSSAANFSFTTDGTGPVILLWNGDILSTDNEAPLNGLILQFDQPIPEPTTATLGLLGFAGLVLRRRRAA